MWCVLNNLLHLFLFLCLYTCALKSWKKNDIKYSENKHQQQQKQKRERKLKELW